MPTNNPAHGPPAGIAASEGRPVHATPRVIPFRTRHENSCNQCQVRGSCFHAGRQEQPASLLEDVPSTRRRVMAGHAVFMEGDPVQFLYAVRQGSFKSVLMLRDGRDQVTRFPMPGDLLGLDGMGGGEYASTPVALEDSEVCAIAIETIHRQLRDAAWSHAMCRLMGQEIVHESRHMLLLASAGTEARVAMFLLERSAAMQARGYSPTEFHLRMTRAEIGSYLGLTLETVSRTLSAFHRRGWIAVQKRHMTIQSLQALQEIRDQDRA